MKKANESKSMWLYPAIVKEDRDLFVENLGWLLSQTREGVERVYIKEDHGIEYAVIKYLSGTEKPVNVTSDSYAAIVRDVIHAI